MPKVPPLSKLIKHTKKSLRCKRCAVCGQLYDQDDVTEADYHLTDSHTPWAPMRE